MRNTGRKQGGSSSPPLPPSLPPGGAAPLPSRGGVGVGSVTSFRNLHAQYLP